MKNPIINTIELNNFGLFSKKPILSPDSKLVIASTSGGYIIVNSSKQLSRGELMSGKYSKIIEIDMHPVSISVQGEYLCSDLVNRFVVEIIGKCEIINPIEIVKNNDNDLKSTISDVITSVCKQIAMENEIEDYVTLNSNVTYFESKINHKLEDYGLEISKTSVVVKPDSDYIQHKKKKVNILREKEETIDKNNMDIDIMESASQVDKKAFVLKKELDEMKMQAIFTLFQEGKEFMLPIVYKDDHEALKMINDMKEKIHSGKKEDLEWMLNLAREYDYDVSEIYKYQNRGNFAGANIQEQTQNKIEDKEKQYEPQELEDEEE